MKTKHTPGPWQVGSTIALRHRVIDGNANEVATMKGEFELEKQANARLIAAAPEMYELLHAIWAKTDPSKDPKTCRAIANLPDQVDETIKARGAK